MVRRRTPAESCIRLPRSENGGLNAGGKPVAAFPVGSGRRQDHPFRARRGVAGQFGSGGYPVVPGAGFHVVLGGSCWLLPPAGAPIALAAGDVVLMPRGADHALADQADEHTPLRSVVDLLVAEVTAQPLGSGAAVPALLDTMLLFLLRAWFEISGARGGGWAAALCDPAVAAALRAVHDDPAHAWSVSELAALATVSRATLARRFDATIGEPPLSYLARWRILVAARLLRDTADPLAAVGHAVGYGSEFAFAKAFKRHHGVAPGAYRRMDLQRAGMPVL
jgi:AraC-like DNA-binding protein